MLYSKVGIETKGYHDKEYYGGNEMDRRGFSNIGDEIKDIVQNAVNSRDFHQLNRDIQNTVQGALDEVHNAINGFGRGGQNWNQPYENRNQWNRQGDNYRQGYRQNNDQGYKQNNEQNDNQNNEQGYKQNGEQGYNQNNERRSGGGYYSYDRHGNRQDNRSWNNRSYGNQWKNDWRTNVNTYAAKQKKEVEPIRKQTSLVPYKEVGKVSSVLLTVFGSIGMSTLGIGAMVLAIVGYYASQNSVLYTIALSLMPLFFVSVFMMAAGGKIRKRLKRFRRYLAIFKDRSYYSLKELTADTGQSKKYILRDLRRMISIGMFPEGRIDEQETCIILNRDSYNQYLETMKNVHTQEVKEQDNVAQNQSAQQTADNPELMKALENGRAYINQIKDANEAIPGEEISRKLYRLEAVIGKIFDYVELHPTQLPEIQKFMEYYLPTTLKLIIAYREFDMQPVQGDNITSAKKEIEDTLDTINLAFEKLLDSLFQDAAMDVSTDISVLETMLAQEGLTKEEFKLNEKMGGKD
jgi:5-bromo-4-chloroindolyl phosphate hydrolysis protein.